MNLSTLRRRSRQTILAAFIGIGAMNTNASFGQQRAYSYGEERATQSANPSALGGRDSTQMAALQVHDVGEREAWTEETRLTRALIDRQFNLDLRHAKARQQKADGEYERARQIAVRPVQQTTEYQAVVQAVVNLSASLSAMRAANGNDDRQITALAIELLEARRRVRNLEDVVADGQPQLTKLKETAMQVASEVGELNDSYAITVLSHPVLHEAMVNKAKYIARASAGGEAVTMAMAIDARSGMNQGPRPGTSGTVAPSPAQALANAAAKAQNGHITPSIAWGNDQAARR